MRVASTPMCCGYSCCMWVQALTLHTNYGDIKLELFCDEVPKACHNFLALAASNYYDGTVFHRNISGFMLQGGDPTGSGTGGRSIFDTPSGKFEDDIAAGLSHDKPGVLSMANSGPHTNGALPAVLVILPRLCCNTQTCLHRQVASGIESSCNSTQTDVVACGR